MASGSAAGTVVPAHSRSFGKYTLVLKLATGGMAEIFLARLKGMAGFEKFVVIKRILPHLADDEQFVNMFLDEARIAARISHPNVCQVYELGEVEGQYFIAMEYLEGATMTGVIRKLARDRRTSDLRLSVALLTQACEGLHHAHDLRGSDGAPIGVVHRDVSPQNLFATVGGVLKVLDFGIAKAAGASSKTRTGTVKGKYAYMSPEQLRGEPLDRRADVFALGVVLFEAVTGRRLFWRETDFLMFKAITEEPIPRASELRPDLPRALDAALARALTRDREQRFPSARAFGEAITNAVETIGGSLGTSAVSSEIERMFGDDLGEQRSLVARVGMPGDTGVGQSAAPAAGSSPPLEGQATVTGRRMSHADELADAPTQTLPASHPSLLLPLPPPDSSAPKRYPAPPEIAKTVAGELTGSTITEPVSGVDVDTADSVDVALPSMPSEPSAPKFRTGTAIAPSLHAPAAPSRRKVIVASALGGLALIVTIAVVAGGSGKDEPEAPPLASNGQNASRSVGLDGPQFEPRVRPQGDPPAVKAEPTPQQPKPVPDAPKVVELEDPKPLPKQDAKVDPKPDVKPDVKPDPKADVKPDVKPDPKQDVKPKPNPPLDKKPPKPLPQVATAPGFVTIDSSPWAQIWIDGKDMGPTPLVRVSLSPGRHSVKAQTSNGTSKQFTITILSGKDASPRKLTW